MKSSRAFWERILSQHGYVKQPEFSWSWVFPCPHSFNDEAWSWFQKENIVVGIVPKPLPSYGIKVDSNIHVSHFYRDKAVDIIIVINPTDKKYTLFRKHVCSPKDEREIRFMIHATVERTLFPLCLKLNESYRPVLEAVFL